MDVKVKVMSCLIRRYFSAGCCRTITDVQKALKEHLSVLKENKSPESMNYKVNSRTMSDSRDKILIPLGSRCIDKQFHRRYTGWDKLVRFGMLLEDLDTFAVWLAYRHNYGTVPSRNMEAMTFVTACVDRISMDVQHRIELNKDIYMDGFVSWVGRSSLEVSMELAQNINGTLKKFLHSKFVMVARDLEGQKSVHNIPLKITNSEEEIIFKKGMESHKYRKRRAETSLLKTPPSSEEINVLHNFFKKTIRVGGHSVRGRFLPPKHVWIHDARLSDTIICFPVKRNIYGKIFGGFLMRKAVELGWANASMFSGNRCRICGVDDIVFRKSVDVGSILLLSSQVCYSKDHYMELIVDAEVLDVVTGSREITNTFYLTFISDCTVPTVIPFSYSEGMLYLDAKRHFDGFAAHKDKL